MKRMIAVAALALCASTALLPAAARAQSSEAWQFNAILYGYFPTIGGTSTFPAGPTPGITVDASQILDALKFGFLGTFEARKGSWGAFTDILYLDVGGSKQETRDLTFGGQQLPAGATANANLDLKTLVWTLAGTYRVLGNRDGTLELLGGARLASIRQKLDYQVTGNLGPIVLPTRNGSSEINEHVWDGIVGVKGQIRFGDDRKWGIPYYLDVGTGQSQLTWQAMAGLGYSFQWGDAFAAWRYLDYNMKAGDKIDSLTLNGPMLGVAFHW